MSHKILTLEKANARLAALRGRARMRVLDARDLLQVLEEARRTEYGLRTGACVANKYGYPAHRMRLVAIRRRTGSYAVLADWGNAKKGSSNCPLGGQQSVWEQTLSREKIKLDPRLSWWIIPRREVERALAERRLVARREAEEHWPAENYPPDLLITVEDSLAAGNCAIESARVAAWWPAGTTAVSAADLRRAILIREPTLTRYAIRAVEAAAARVARVG